MKKDVPLCINFLTKKTPYKGLGADSEEKHERVGDIDTAAVDSLKTLDPKRPIREATRPAAPNLRRSLRPTPSPSQLMHIYFYSLMRRPDLGRATASNVSSVDWPGSA